MQRSGVGLRIKFHGRKRQFCVNIAWLDCQRTIQHRFFFTVPPENSVTDCNLLQREKVARIEVNRVLETSCGLFPVPLPPLDVTLQLDYLAIIGQGLGSNFQFSEGTVIIALSGGFLTGRDFRVKLLSDLLCDLTLDCEDVGKIAIISLCP